MRDAKAGGATPHALFFLHGFNLSFEDAAILAAPDVDRDLFLHLARLYPEHSERTTLYASDGDLPVHLSARMHPGRVRDA
jgi:esterase/lipase superfamily enzyme